MKTVIQVQDEVIARLLRGNPDSGHYRRTRNAAWRWADKQFARMGYGMEERRDMYRQARDMATLERLCDD